jgi:branched-chain amino acid transport system substrate-binding protein
MGMILARLSIRRDVVRTWGRAARALALGTVVAASAALLAACGSSGSSGDSISVGAISILSGPSKTIGLDTIRGSQFEVGRINQAGGVLGRKLRLITADGQNDPKVAVQAAGRLLRDDKVTALLGPVNSVSALTALSLVSQAKVPMVVYNAGAEKLTSTKSPWVIRSSTTISAGFEGLVKYVREKGLAKKFAIIGWDLAPGASGVNGAKAGAAKYGGQIASVQQLPLDTQDFSSAISKARSSGADALMIDAPMPFAGVLAKQVAAAGWHVRLLGWGGFLAEDFGGFAGPASNGMLMTDTGHPEAVANRPQAVRFITAFKARYGREPNANELIGADAVGIVAAGIKKAGSTDGTKIQQAIHSMRMAGIRLDYSWTPAGDVVNHPIVVVKWENGKLGYVDTLH